MTTVEIKKLILENTDIPEKNLSIGFTRIGCQAVRRDRHISEHTAHRLFFWTKMFSFNAAAKPKTWEKWWVFCAACGMNTRPTPFQRKGSWKLSTVKFWSTQLQYLACLFVFLCLSSPHTHLLFFLNADLSLVAKICIRSDFSFFALWKNDRIIYPGWKTASYRLVHVLKQYFYFSSGHLSHLRQRP